MLLKYHNSQLQVVSGLGIYYKRNMWIKSGVINCDVLNQCPLAPILKVMKYNNKLQQGNNSTVCNICFK